MRDVVELQVAEHAVPVVPQGTDGVGADRAVELEAHLGDAEPGLEVARQAVGGDQVVDVEGQREAAPQLLWGFFRHAELRSDLAPP